MTTDKIDTPERLDTPGPETMAWAVVGDKLIDVLHCCDTEAQQIAYRIAGPRGEPCRHPDGVQVLEDAETIIRAAIRVLDDAEGGA